MPYNTSLNKSHLISIIIPIYNGALFIKEAYRVIIKQQVPDFEILFIDNNSVDNSVGIINDILKNDSRVSLYKESVQGAASARNTGLKHAKGDFIYFFDVDDQLFENALNALLAVLLKNKDLDSVHGNMVKSNFRLKDAKINLIDTNVLTVNEPYYWGIRWMHYGKLSNTGCFLHRAFVFDKTGRFNPKLMLGEDAAFHVKLGMECSIGHLDKKVLLYYRHQDSTVSTQNKITAKEFTYWEPLIHEHLPYLLTHQVPLAFKKKVLLRVYGYIPKMLALTKGYTHRKQLKNKLVKDIKPLRIPWVLKPFISLIMLTGWMNLYKFYGYYILKYYMKYVLK
ncbi:glycosyltransferase family A protein [Bizionia arctica]|uniref:Glycosyltransferase 2-like domain-containing protein n=1 Tax=Bizionia arctica TaxID=1495645 RepID=A0A917GP22_9FLAO|nr:glycosyltransferase family A protein [Bizionia arctica]GGG53059.1 hypothetical protein GCM10010976_25160 [Bizionia arctica]